MFVRDQGAGGGKASGQEERDFMFAGLFGCIAVHRSGILVAKPLVRRIDWL